MRAILSRPQCVMLLQSIMLAVSFWSLCFLYNKHQNILSCLFAYLHCLYTSLSCFNICKFKFEFYEYMYVPLVPTNVFR